VGRCVDVFQPAGGFGCEGRWLDSGGDEGHVSTAPANPRSLKGDVRTALDIDEWNLSIRGTSSTVGFEVMSRYPEHIRSVYFDSPDPPEVDLFTEAVIGIRYAIARLSEACGNDSRCKRAFPDLERTLRHDLLALHRRPGHIRTADGELTLRDTTLVRWVRQWLATATTPRPRPSPRSSLISLTTHRRQSCPLRPVGGIRVLLRRRLNLASARARRPVQKRLASARGERLPARRLLLGVVRGWPGHRRLHGS